MIETERKDKELIVIQTTIYQRPKKKKKNCLPNFKNCQVGSQSSRTKSNLQTIIDGNSCGDLWSLLFYILEFVGLCQTWLSISTRFGQKVAALIGLKRLGMGHL